MDLGRAHGQRPARPEHPAHGDELLARRRGEEVHLELDREHLPPRLHQRERSVPARAVGDSRDGGGVEVAVLLREVVAERERDLDLPGSHSGEVGTERPHHPLQGEAVADTGFEGRVARLEGDQNRGWQEPANL